MPKSERSQLRRRGLRQGDLRAASARRPRRVRRTPWPSASASRRRRPRGWSRSSTSSGSSRTCPTSGVAADRRTGARVALEVLRHHRLLELYLAETLGVPWDRVHDEAEVLEHAHLRGARGADRGASSATRRTIRTATRSRPPTLTIDERDTLRAAGARRRRRAAAFVRDLGLRPRDAALPRPSAGSRPATRFEVVEKQPFDGPAVRALRRRRARARRRRSPAAMRVEAPRERRPPRAVAAVARSRRRPAPATSQRDPRRAAACAGDPARCSARRSSPASPTSTRATSPRTSPAARSTATCCCGSLLAANLMAMLIQNLSAKLGIATGQQPARAVPRALPARA